MKRRTFLKQSACAVAALPLMDRICFGQDADRQVLTFYAMSDTHVGHVIDREKGTVKERCEEVAWINSLPGTAYPETMGGVVGPPRGVVMAGDLINDGALADRYPKQWADWGADFGVDGEGRCRFPVFEGVGNHDVNLNLFVFNQLHQRNRKRLMLGSIGHVSDNGYHYSWDWNGVHFVNVNIFPGNEWHGEADAYGPAHDPLFARDFLEKDLRENVGNSGRPVILIQHFRPIDDNWWTYAAADKCQRILQDYNVILIMCGHAGGGINNTWRGIDWATSNGPLQVFRIAGKTLEGVVRNEAEWGQQMKKTIYRSYEDCELPAVVNNGNWAIDVETDRATLTGKILYEAVSPSQAAFYYGTTDGGNNAAAWSRCVEAGQQAVDAVFGLAITGLEPWTDYYYRVRVRNSRGDAWAAASIPFRTKGRLTKGWQEQFIGYAQRPWAGAHQEAGVFQVRGSGRDIGEPGQPDNFEFASTPVAGEATIQARIDKLEGRTRDPKAGIMLRETSVSRAAHTALLVSNHGGLQLYARLEAGGPTTVSPRNDARLPLWVRLVRQGDRITGYMSSDGENWEQVGQSLEVLLKPTIHAGLAVTAGNRDGSQHTTGYFSEVAVTTERKDQ